MFRQQQKPQHQQVVVGENFSAPYLQHQNIQPPPAASQQIPLCSIEGCQTICYYGKNGHIHDLCAKHLLDGLPSSRQEPQRHSIQNIHPTQYFEGPPPSSNRATFQSHMLKQMADETNIMGKASNPENYIRTYYDPSDRYTPPRLNELENFPSPQSDLSPIMSGAYDMGQNYQTPSGNLQHQQTQAPFPQTSNFGQYHPPPQNTTSGQYFQQFSPAIPPAAIPPAAIPPSHGSPQHYPKTHSASSISSSNSGQHYQQSQVSSSNSGRHYQQSQVLPSQVPSNAAQPKIPQCANPSCVKPCFIDENGKIYNHCGGPSCSPQGVLPSDPPQPVGPPKIKRFPTALVPGKVSKTRPASTVEMVPASKILREPAVGRKCSRQGCNNDTFMDPEDPTKFHAYCDKKCYWIEVHQLKKTKLTTLVEDDSDYLRILKPFLHGLPLVTIKGVIRIQMPIAIVDKHLDLRTAIANETNQPPEKITHRMYHGTKVTCGPLGIIHSGTLCSNPECGMCGICREGNKSAKSKHGNQMFFTDNPRLAINSCGQNPKATKAMFIVDVLAPQYHSLLVVDKDACTLPRYCIIFE